MITDTLNVYFDDWSFLSFTTVFHVAVCWEYAATEPSYTMESLLFEPPGKMNIGLKNHVHVVWEIRVETKVLTERREKMFWS